MTSGTGGILVARNDGFGARMMPFVSALRLHHKCGIPVYLYWPTNANPDFVTNEYRELFSDAFIDKFFISEAEYKALTACALPSSALKGLSAEELQQQVASGVVFTLDSASERVALEGEAEADIRDGYRTAMEAIIYRPTVQQYMAKIDAQIGGGKSVAYHVRHGDVTMRYRARGKPWPVKFIPCEIYAEHIKVSANEQGARVMLFGDLEASLDWIQASNPGLVRLRDIVDTSSLGRLQFDFMDLYAMSRHQRIVAPKMSGFSMLAANMGGGEFVDIMEDLGPARKRAAFEALANRISTAPGSFSSDGEIGQSLAHLMPAMLEAGAREEARYLLQQEVARGNRISFLKSMLSDICLDDGKLDAVLEIQRNSRETPVYEGGTLSAIDGNAARAAARRGDGAKAARLATSAVFLQPRARDNTALIASLDAAEILSPQNFYPFDRAFIRALSGRRFEVQKRYDLLPLIWDWEHHFAASMGRALTHGGAAQAAKKQLDRVLRSRGEADAGLVAEGQSLLHVIDFKLTCEASHVAEVAALAERHTDQPQIAFRHAKLLTAMGQNDAARDVLVDLVRRYPDIAFYRGVLADAHVKLRAYDDAIASYEALPFDVSYLPTFALGYAKALRTRRRREEAENVLTDAARASGWSDRFLHAVMPVKLENDSWQDMVPMLEDLLREGGEIRRLHRHMAQIEKERGHPEKALAYLEDVLAWSPDLPSPNMLYAELLLDVGRKDEAAERLARFQTQLSHNKRYQALLSEARGDELRSEAQ